MSELPSEALDVFGRQRALVLLVVAVVRLAKDELFDAPSRRGAVREITETLADRALGLGRGVERPELPVWIVVAVPVVLARIGAKWWLRWGRIEGVRPVRHSPEAVDARGDPRVAVEAESRHVHATTEHTRWLGAFVSATDG